MNLTEEQKRVVAAWVEGGASLSEVQNRLRLELGISLTYMDVRFLLADLDLEPKEKPKRQPGADLAGPPPASAGERGPGAAGDFEAEEELSSEEMPGSGEEIWEDGLPNDLPPPAGGKVSVEADKVMRPGTMVSGTVKFSDGVSATWQIDHYGRLGIVPPKPGYQPTQDDLMDFQTELQRVLRKYGF